MKLLPLVTTLLLASCAATRVNKLALESATGAWEGVEADFQRGLADGQAKGDLTLLQVEDLTRSGKALGAALKAGDAAAAREVDWATIENWAKRGVKDRVDDGEVSEGVATSLYERIWNLGQLLRVVRGDVSVGGRQLQPSFLSSSERGDWFRQQLGLPVAAAYPDETQAQIDARIASWNESRIRRIMKLKGDLAEADRRLVGSH